MSDPTAPAVPARLPPRVPHCTPCSKALRRSLWFVITMNRAWCRGWTDIPVVVSATSPTCLLYDESEADCLGSDTCWEGQEGRIGYVQGHPPTHKLLTSKHVRVQRSCEPIEPPRHWRKRQSWRARSLNSTT